MIPSKILGSPITKNNNKKKYSQAIGIDKIYFSNFHCLLYQCFNFCIQII